MNYKFTDMDRRTYERDSDEQIKIDSRIRIDGDPELIIADSKGVFIALRMNQEEAVAISLAASACRDKCKTRILIGEIEEEK